MLYAAIIAINIGLLESTESIAIILLKLTKVVFIIGIKFSSAWIAWIKIRIAVFTSISFALLFLIYHLGISWRS